MIMRFKEGVALSKGKVAVLPVTVEGMLKVAEAYCKTREKLMRWHPDKYCTMPGELVITSVMDGKHSKYSLHYKGAAFDTRTWADNRGNQLSKDDKKTFAQAYKKALGPDWDVVVEDYHIHLEYDPE